MGSDGLHVRPSLSEARCRREELNTFLRYPLDAFVHSAKDRIHSYIQVGIVEASMPGMSARVWIQTGVLGRLSMGHGFALWPRTRRRCAFIGF